MRVGGKEEDLRFVHDDPSSETNAMRDRLPSSRKDGDFRISDRFRVLLRLGREPAGEPDSGGLAAAALKFSCTNEFSNPAGRNRPSRPERMPTSHYSRKSGLHDLIGKAAEMPPLSRSLDEDPTSTRPQ
jgi:hypothetical protein